MRLSPVYLVLALIAGPLCADGAQPLTGRALINAKHCGHGSQPPCPPSTPTPIINFSPASPSMTDSDSIGTQITQVVVTMSDGSAFSGTLGFASPYNSDGGICAFSGQNIVLGASFPAGDSTQLCTITATQ